MIRLVLVEQVDGKTTLALGLDCEHHVLPLANGGLISTPFKLSSGKKAKVDRIAIITGPLAYCSIDDLRDVLAQYAGLGVQLIHSPESG